MQPLTDDQRALLVARRIDILPGLEVLDAALNVTEDISGDLVGGRVARNMFAQIHGTCQLQVTQELAWGAVLVRPYLVLSDGTVTERFNLGVFALTTPERPMAELPTTYDVAGYDRLYLLNREVGDSYEVAAGTGYVAAMRQVITDAGLTGVLIDETSLSELPKAMSWPLIPSQEASGLTTWLRILNDLAAAVNYRGFWADENGRYRSGPYLEPALRSPEFTFTADDPSVTIVGENRVVLEDRWRQANKWVFVQQNRDTEPTEGDGIYTVDQSADTDLLGGLVWPKQVTVDVADQTALEAYGDRVVAAALRQVTTLRVTTGPFPAGHADVFTYVDAAAGGPWKVQTASWDLDLVAGDCEFEWEVIE